MKLLIAFLLTFGIMLAGWEILCALCYLIDWVQYNTKNDKGTIILCISLFLGIMSVFYFKVL